MKTQTAIPLAEVIGTSGRRLRGVFAAARKCRPDGAGYLPMKQSRADKVRVYRLKHEQGRFSAETWAAIVNNYPELA